MKTVPVDEIKILCGGLDHPECVVYHPDGLLYAGSESGGIYRISLDGQVKEVANTGGFILGMAVSPDGSWMAVCDLGKYCVWRLDLSDMRLQLLLNSVDGTALKTPNFISFDSKGGIYLSDSGDFKQGNGLVYKIGANRRARIWHEGPFGFANGLAISPDEKYLYVACSFLPGIERVEILPNGDSGMRELVLEMPKTVPDGLAFAADGTLFISCYSPNAIYVLQPGGQLHELVNDWEAHTLANPTNMAFGGESFDQLFIANLGRWHISQIDLRINGLPLVCHQNK